MTSIAPVTLVLAAAVLVAFAVSFAFGRRGGRFRSLPGWAVFWLFFATLLVVLPRAPRPVALVLLGVFMFLGLREFFFVAPLRPRDRYAILLSYVSIPLVLWPELQGPWTLFLVVSTLAIFVLLPMLLVAGTPQGGMFEATGRFFLGLLAFVYCASHLGLMIEHGGGAESEMFGILVLAAEIPQRLAGRARSGEGALRPALGILAGAGLAALVGATIGPLCTLDPARGAVAGALVAAGTAAGSFFAEAAAQDLSLGAPAARVGRGAFLDRTLPALLAAPFFFYFTNRLLALP
jgi:predicted CDP-diglyceride synthetase/phosphatidate cytidylyltransferase